MGRGREGERKEGRETGKGGRPGREREGKGKEGRVGPCEGEERDWKGREIV